MFKGQITYDHLTLRYPPSVAQFLMEEIEKADRKAIIANQDAVYKLLTTSIQEDFLLQAVA